VTNKTCVRKSVYGFGVAYDMFS